MLKSVAIVMIFVLLGGAGVLATASSAEESVRNLEQQWLQNEGNAAVLESILAEDFIHVLPSGFVTKQEQLEFVRKHPRSDRETRHSEELRGECTAIPRLRTESWIRLRRVPLR